MADSNFIDYVKILCRSGKGGAGSMHFHRAKYVPKGGPDGGDGGRGGHVILRGNKNMWTLLPLKYSRHVFATNGQSGGAGRSFGKDGEDKIIEVPCGTVVFDAETGEYLCEVTDDGQGYPPAVLAALQEPESSEDAPHILGLHVVEQIAAAHGGTAVFEQSHPHGARAIIRLPLGELARSA